MTVGDSIKGVTLRKASLADRSTLLEFEQKVLAAERPYNGSIKASNATYYDIDDLLTSSNSFLLVAQWDGTVVGCGYAQIRPSKQSLVHEFHSYFGFMYVDAQYRGRGINKNIIDSLVSWSREQGVLDCYLDVYSQNASAVRAYEKVGFVTSMMEMKLHAD